jgi:D-alanyl-D-alanine carboxypeptidase/D-alanyl-D-alanine-endopeptidase (penicillin-binding protein 4)
MATTSTRRLVIHSVLILVLCVFAPLREIKAQTLSPETQQQINAILDAPDLREAHIGISILDLGTVKDASTFPAKPHLGKPYRVLFERDADKCFMPASNMKLFTAAIALQLLGKDKTFPTRIVMHSDGDVLRISGGGDPSLSYGDLQALATELSGTSFHGPPMVISEGLAFSAETAGEKFPFGWTIDDTRWYYGPEISALAVNRNQLDIKVIGGSKSGEPAKVTIGPAEIAHVVGVVNTVTTGEENLASEPFENLINCDYASDSHGGVFLYVSGRVAPNQELKEGLSVPVPQNLVTQLFLLACKPIVHSLAPYIAGSMLPRAPLVGWNYTLQPLTNSGSLLLPEPHKALATHDSPPLKVLFQRFLKNSDNLYAEMLLRDASYYYDGTGGDKAGPHAHELLKKWLIGQGIDVSTLRFEDGSGLSRYNLLTPRATARLLAAINSMKDGDVIWNALPIGGVDGTMKNRVQGTAAQNNARAKSGTFSIASNLSGYVTTRDNHRLAVSLYMNFARDGDAARRAEDAVFAALADTTIKFASP